MAAAARAAGLPLARARERFPGRAAILLRFGRLADQAALTEAPSDGPVRDRLFDLLMRRIDALAGAPCRRAGAAARLARRTADSRCCWRWQRGAACVGCWRRPGSPTRGIHGELRVKGLVAVWLWTIRAWRADESEDLSATMAALDTALRRAEQAAEWLGWRAPRGGSRRRRPASEPPPRGAARGAGLSLVALPPIKGAQQEVR